MFLMDVIVLVYAHREDVAHHSAYRQWSSIFWLFGVGFEQFFPD
jgi:predicted nucleic acid-binding protein